MVRSRPLLVTAYAFATSASAAYDQYFFATERGNWRCSSNLGFDCPPPQVCAFNALLQKHYCCGPGAQSVCWSGATECGGSNGKPATGKMSCSSGQNAFCCLSDREECTQRENQINICWATGENILQGVAGKDLNNTFSSLSSARPRATSLTFDVQAMLSSLSATSALSTGDIPSTAEPGGNAPTTGSGDNTNTNNGNGNGNSDSSLSGGAIAGIVIGAVAGLALMVLATFFLLRRRKAKSQKTDINEADANPYSNASNPYATNGEYMGVAQAPPPPMEKYRHSAEAPGGAVALEADNTQAPAEMPVNSQPVEIDGNGVERR